MKKLNACIILLIMTALILSSCGQTASEENTPEKTVDHFLQSLQKQNYADSNSYYSENLDNMANFRNQIEHISPEVANKLFSKMADFTYTINHVTIDPSNPQKAQADVTITSYDLGSSFENTVLDYIKSDLTMTFDGAKNEDIIKEAQKVIVKEIENASQTFQTQVTIQLTKKEKNWKLDKISDNPELLNALSGNIIFTIDKLTQMLSSLNS